MTSSKSQDEKQVHNVLLPLILCVIGIHTLAFASGIIAKSSERNVVYTTNARKHSGSSDYGCGAYLLVFAVLLGIYMMLFFWYANTAIARTYPTPYTNAFWGWLHGTFAIPSFIVSLFNDDVAIYQSPNSGGWYNFGYLVGVGAFFGSAKRSARKK